MALKIDRQTTTPFLLKLFYHANTFHRLDEFTPAAQPAAHLQIYTWPTCSLRELTHLLTSALPDMLPRPAAGTRVAFRLVYPDTRPGPAPQADGPGRFLAKELGSVVVGQDGLGEPERSLADARLVIGDWVCCAVLPPLANGQVAPPPPAPRAGHFAGGGMRAFGGPRENGGGGGGYRGGGGRSGFDYGRGPPGSVPHGEWRRGERLPEGAAYRGGPPRVRGW